MPAANPLRSLGAVAVAAFGASLYGACRAPDIYEPVRVDNMREAGSVHVSVLAVAPWQRRVGDLQPDFQLTEQEALAAVIRDSRRVEREALSAIALAADYEKDEQEGSYATPADTGLAVGGGGPAPPAYPYEGKGLDERPDAMLEYMAATALYQEVQLLSHYLRDAAIPAGHRAYVVRMQVSLLPRLRHEPYDAYTTISFFTPEHALAAEEPGFLVRGATGPVEAGAAAPPRTRLREGDLAVADDDGPHVLTLLVTDNLEASFESRAMETVRALAISLASFSPQIARSMGFDAFQSSSSNQVYGRDLNSLLTVSTLTDNSIYVRIGAMQEATANYAMVPRNHNITLLLTVPEGAPGEIELVSRTVLVDAMTGEELPGTDRRAVLKLYEEVLEEHDLELEVDALERLLAAAQQNHQREFRRVLREALGDGDPRLAFASSLWVDLVRLFAGSTWASASFELPGHGAAIADLSPVFYDQTPVLLDDGAELANLTVRGIRLPDGAEVEGVLRVVGAEPRIELLPEQVELDPTTGEVRLTFTSLAAYDLYRTDEASGLRLRLSWNGDEFEFDVVYRVRVPVDVPR